MDPVVEHLPPHDAAVLCETFDLDRFPFFWHLHPELELTLILAGEGTRHVGDHVGTFAAGDLVLIGPGLPHSWLSQGGGGRSAAVVVRFGAELVHGGQEELVRVRRLLAAAARGLAFPGAPQELRARLAELPELDPLPRLLALVALLDDLAAAPAEPLASAGYRQEHQDRSGRVIDDVRTHVVAHHDEPLSLTAVAAIAHMTPSSLSRAFRRATGQTFSAYVNEVRVGAASRLLVETDLTVAAIAAQAGFRNLANFNRRFREARGMTPTAYRRRFTDAA